MLTANTIFHLVIKHIHEKNEMSCSILSILLVLEKEDVLRSIGVTEDDTPEVERLKNFLWGWMDAITDSLP